MEQSRTDQLSDLNLRLENETRIHLSQAAKWGKFISIVAFLGCVIFLFAAFALGSRIMEAIEKIYPAGMPIDITGNIIIAIIVFVIIIVAATYYFLLNFAIKLRQGLVGENSDKVTAAFSSLKIFFILTTLFAALGLMLNIYNLFDF